MLQNNIKHNVRHNVQQRIKREVSQIGKLSTTKFWAKTISESKYKIAINFNMIILNFSSEGGMPQPVGVQSRDQTVIIVPNSGKFIFQ